MGGGGDGDSGGDDGGGGENLYLPISFSLSRSPSLWISLPGSPDGVGAGDAVLMVEPVRWWCWRGSRSMIVPMLVMVLVIVMMMGCI
ncbi:hypothetical protein BVC80_8013g6 [Macleaya cordata]|uniref:Transmembrane protein n=1 Tax=Macleaya cordata TaxID=56857 RepID=A0A200Q8S7_MACCD|nr:hypothetical protein BVC80_8013g6 [Macleaya cordata]